MLGQFPLNLRHEHHFSVDIIARHDHEKKVIKTLLNTPMNAL